MTYASGRIRNRIHPVDCRCMYRVVRNKYRNTPLRAKPTLSRFSDPNGSYSVIYGADTVRCGFCETAIRDKFAGDRPRELPRSEIDSRAVATLCSAMPLWLVDLRRDGPTRIGAPTAVVHDRRQLAGRALSAATYAMVPEADGFLYPSRFTGDDCVAVFDRAIRKLRVLDVAPLAEYSDVYPALNDYGIDLTTPA